MQSKDNGKHSYLSPNFPKINYAKPNTKTVLLNQRTAVTKNDQQLPFYHQYSYIYFKSFNKKIISNNNPDTTSKYKSEFYKKPLTYKSTNTVKKDKFEHITPLKLPYIEEIYQKHLEKTELNKIIFPELPDKNFLSFQYDRYLSLNKLLNTIETNENNKEDRTRFYFELKVNKIPSKRKNTVRTDKTGKSSAYVKINKPEIKDNIRFFKMKHIRHIFLQTKLYKSKFHTESDRQSKRCNGILQDYDKTIIKDFIITGYLPKTMKNSINPFNSLQADVGKTQNSLNILKDNLGYFSTQVFFKNEVSLYA